MQKAKNYRLDCVNDWNPHSKNVNQSLLLGVSGIDEKDAEGATAVAIELCSLFGMIEPSDNGTMQKTDLFNQKFMIINGDRKTHENTEAFATLAQDRLLSVEARSAFADLVLDVLDRALFAPGDWHTGLNMLQCIYNTYWHLFLKHMKDWLKIARLSKDICNCFYEANKLVVFCSREFSRYLLHIFVSRNWDTYRAKLPCHCEADVITQLALDFDAYLTEEYQATHSAVDQHLKSIVGFLLTA